MISKSQNGEDLFVLNYFGDYKGRLLEIGANDGVTLSNSKLLIEKGWEANLVEPGSTYQKLWELHRYNQYVSTHNVGIGDKFERKSFYESGAHIKDGDDIGLVSTFDFEETKRWTDVEFIKKEVVLLAFSDFVKYAPFDFISIDAEGMDWQILQQIDLEAVGCKCLCIEWNSDNELGEKFANYCQKFGLVPRNVSAENIIFCK